MSDDEQMCTIQDQHWVPFEYYNPEDIYDLIDTLTYDVQRILEKGI